MKKLDPKAVWLFFLQYSLGWIIFMFFFSFCFFGPIILSILEDNPNDSVFLGSSLLIYFVGFVVFSAIVIVLSYIFAKLSYNNYKYELKEDGFYKESGVIAKRYVTIPYERIQNVDIHRGLLSRFLGLSDLQIQTAGMSFGYTQNGYGMGVEGRLPAVSKEDALTIRDEVIKRAKGKKQHDGL